MTILVDGILPPRPGNAMREVPATIEDGTLGTFYLGQDLNGGDIILVIESNAKDGLAYSITSNHVWVHEDGQPINYKDVEVAANTTGKKTEVMVTNPTQRDISVTAKWLT